MPLMFSFRELTQVLDSAARCAAGLNAASVLEKAPGRLAEMIRGASGTERARGRELEWDYRLRHERYRLQTEHQARLAVLDREAKARNLALVDAQIWRAVAESRVRAVWIWGAGKGGRTVAEEIARRNGRIVGFLISSGERGNATEQRLPVLPWAEAADEGVVRGRAFVVVVSVYANEIEPLLTGAGWQHGRDFEVLGANEAIELAPFGAAAG